ncbi:MAG: hypothetical protein DDT29_02045 [Dehalococcoidia bacterium]|nr:hypothetical protein [Bacillota bacterium]
MLLSIKELVELGLNGGDVKLYTKGAVTIFLLAFTAAIGARLADYVWMLLFGQ